MSVIGTFKLAKDGGWVGCIRTLALDAKVRLIPNDNRSQPNAPAFRVMLGRSHVGDAWEVQSTGDSRRHYLRVRLDDPSLPEPLSAALFLDGEGDDARLVWGRRPVPSGGGQMRPHADARLWPHSSGGLRG